MDKGNTKCEILYAALNLFSKQGYEATSVSQIAAAVGIKKSSLYSHFKSKQAILDALIKDVLEKYNNTSIFANDEPKNVDGVDLKSAEEVVQIVKRQVTYILHNDYIAKARKLLTIEQFRNSTLAELQTKQNYVEVMKYFTNLLKGLTGKGILSGDDFEIMVAQFCLPITAWINLCDRDRKRENEIMDLIERHICQFFTIYSAKGR